MRADELHFAEPKACEFAQARLIGASLAAVDVRRRLEPAQAPRRSPALGRDLARDGNKASPQWSSQSSARLDRDAAMPACGREAAPAALSSRVPGIARTDEKPNQDSPSSSAEPVFDFGGVRRDSGFARLSSDRSEAARSSAAKTWTTASEIADPSRVVEVKVGRHDVADIAWAEARIGDLPERVGDVEPRPAPSRVERKSKPTRLVDVHQLQTSINQDKSAIALDQEAVTAHGGGRRAPAAPRTICRRADEGDGCARLDPASGFSLTDLSSASTIGKGGIAQLKGHLTMQVLAARC